MPTYLRHRHPFRWASVALAVLLVIVLVFVVAPSLLMGRTTRSHIVAQTGEAPSATVAIVLGAAADKNGVPSKMLADRLATAVALYREGKVSKLLLSGDGSGLGLNQVGVMLAYCRTNGVPDQALLTDGAGFDTYDTMYRARDVYSVTDALVVSQDFHLYRAVYIARRLGLRATGVVANIQHYSEVVPTAREWAARLKALWELFVTKPKPSDLGPIVPTSDDAGTSGF